MLTPQEVSERAFQRASFGGGYNMAQVDEFLDILTGDYTALFNENAVLKNKMKVLLDKMEEYRSTEDAMRKTLLTAQRMADDLVKEAEEKKASIIQEAEKDVLARRDDLARAADAEEARLTQARQATAEFVKKVTTLQAEETQLLNRLLSLSPTDGTPAPAPADPVEQTVSEIDGNVQRLLAKAIQDPDVDITLPPSPEKEPETQGGQLDDTAEFLSPPRFLTQEQIEEQAAAQTSFPATAPEAEEDVDDLPPRHRIDFEKLQFGRDYEIK